MKPGPKPSLQCKRGHRLDSANIYRGANGRQCRICVLGNQAQAWRTTPHKRIAHRVDVLKFKYGLTLDAYHAILERQDFHCALCATEDRLEVNHDHQTSKVRGLLCGKHNKMLGLSGDNATMLRAGASYLDRC